MSTALSSSEDPLLPMASSLEITSALLAAAVTAAIQAGGQIKTTSAVVNGLFRTALFEAVSDSGSPMLQQHIDNAAIKAPVITTANAALEMISASCGTSFHGLGDGVRHLAGRIPSGLKRRLDRLNKVQGHLKHTTSSIDRGLLSELESALAASHDIECHANLVAETHTAKEAVTILHPRQVQEKTITQEIPKVSHAENVEQKVNAIETEQETVDSQAKAVVNIANSYVNNMNPFGNPQHIATDNKLWVRTAQSNSKDQAINVSMGNDEAHNVVDTQEKTEMINVNSKVPLPNPFGNTQILVSDNMFGIRPAQGNTEVQVNNEHEAVVSQEKNEKNIAVSYANDTKSLGNPPAICHQQQVGAEGAGKLGVRGQQRDFGHQRQLPGYIRRAQQGQ